MHHLLVLLLCIISLVHAESSRESDSLVLLSIKANNPVVQGSTITWTLDKPMAQWSGVYLDKTSGRVNRLEFKSCSLIVIPTEIQSLDSLDYLDIRRNKLDMRTMEPELVKYVNKVSSDRDWATRQIIDYGGSRETDSLVLLELARLNPWLEWDTTRPYGVWGDGVEFGSLNNNRVTGLRFFNDSSSEYGQALLRLPETIIQLSMLSTFIVEGSGRILINGVDSSYLPDHGIIIDSFPSGFWKLPFLQTLKISSTHFQKNNLEIGNAKYLKTISFAYTPFDSLPESLGSLLSLDTLNLFFCNVGYIPTGVSSLKLRYLDVSLNHLFKENLPTGTVNWLNTYAPNWESDQFRPTVSVIPHTSNPKRSLTISSSNAQLTFSEWLPHGTTLRIHDLKGRVLFQGLVSGTTMALPTLSTGTYLVSIANRHINTTAKVQITGSSVR